MRFEIEIPDEEFNRLMRDALRGELGPSRGSDSRAALQRLVTANIGSFITEETCGKLIRATIEESVKSIAAEVVDGKLRRLIKQEVNKQIAVAGEQMNLGANT